MASRREIKRRIRSISNTSQITKAFQMISAARMRRAQQRVQSARPYSEQIRALMADVAGKAGVDTHELLAAREVRTAGIITITPDRGLTGGLVTNINRETARLVQSLGVPVRVIAAGRKGRDFAARSRLNLVAEYTGLGDQTSIGDIAPIAQQALQEFQSGQVDAVYLVYPKFVSTLKQQPTSVQLLPVVPPEGAEETRGTWDYEPDNPAQVLSALIPRYIEFTVYAALLESLASEHSARMIAMSNATENAQDLIKDLTLLMNKARQAEITKEIAEISGAAEAMRSG